MSDDGDVIPEATSLPPVGDAPVRRGGRPKGSTNKRYKRKIHARSPREAGVAQPPRTSQDAEPSRMGRDQAAAPVRYEAEGQITRQSLEERQINVFDIPQHERKPGWDYKWEVFAVNGMRMDRSTLRDAHMAGWRAEKASSWPTLGEGLGPDDAIEVGGQMLMGRPIHLSIEAQNEAYNRAKQQERDRMQAASSGQGMQGQEGLSNIRGIQVRGSQLDVQLAVGDRPLFNRPNN